MLPHDLIPAPSTPLGSFSESFRSWTTWSTLMGFVGVAAFALIAAGPAARRAGEAVTLATTRRLARTAAVLGLLGLAALIAADSWATVFDGSTGGLLAGLEFTLLALGAVLVLPLAFGRLAAGPSRAWLLTGAVLAGVVSLGTTKFPVQAPDPWGRTVFETGMWLLHLSGGGVWLGGLLGLLVLALPGGVPTGQRGAFWGPAIRRFSVAAMSCVAAIALSGLWFYWEHVDGPTQLVTTMYGRVLGVKILIFGVLLLLGMANQFWLHPRIDALRAGGDTRPLLVLLTREFPAVVALEAVLVLSVLMVAPFLHGSARDQAFQADAAKTAPAGTTTLPRIGAKEVSTSTWLYGTAETVAVIAIMAGGYRVSGRLARRRTVSVPAEGHPEPAEID
jgi:putative copper export protein